jgi:hypothetical protein
MAVSERALPPPVETYTRCSTHQLLPQKYSDDCVKYVERFVNQWVVSHSWLLLLMLNIHFLSDDKVEESHLSNAFDITCRAWEVRQPLPGLHTCKVLKT